jgi:hypothetical protein
MSGRVGDMGVVLVERQVQIPIAVQPPETVIDGLIHLGGFVLVDGFRI